MHFRKIDSTENSAHIYIIVTRNSEKLQLSFLERKAEKKSRQIISVWTFIYFGGRRRRSGGKNDVRHGEPARLLLTRVLTEDSTELVLSFGPARFVQCSDKSGAPVPDCRWEQTQLCSFRVSWVSHLQVPAAAVLRELCSKPKDVRNLNFSKPNNSRDSKFQVHHNQRVLQISTQFLTVRITRILGLKRRIWLENQYHTKPIKEYCPDQQKHELGYWSLGKFW